MNQYKNLMSPEFKLIAHNFPFNIPVLKIAAYVQPLLLKMTPVPKDIRCRKFLIKGYQGLGVPVDVFEPKQAEGKLPCILYIHGGGFGYKAAPYHKKLACVYAREVNCRVVFPDYHLLPEYPFPAAYEDVIAVYRWICSRAKKLEIDQTHIAVAGDSAGGALAANLCNTAESRHLVRPCVQILLYPVTDAKMRTKAMKRFTDTPLWNSVNNRKMWRLYLQQASAEERKLASPMENTLPEWIPDTYIETAELDCLHDDGILYAKKLRKAGAKVIVNETRRTIHGYDSAMSSSITKVQVAERIKLLKKKCRLA